MKKTFITLLAVAISAIASAQHYTPKWKVGDHKTATTTTNEKEWENGELMSDTSEVSDIDFKVTAESATDFTLAVIIENATLKALATLAETMEEDIKQYKDIKLVYSVNKTTGKADLTNWEEVQSFMYKGYDKMKEMIDDKIPEMGVFAEMIFSPIKEAYSTKEGIEGAMEPTIGFIMTPFAHEFKGMDSLSVTDNAPNPFNPEMSMTSTTYLWLKPLDNTGGRAEIGRSIVMDLTEFKKMMSDMMAKMSDSFGGDEKKAKETAAEIENFDMDMTNVQLITYDIASTWPTKVVATSEVIANEPRKKTKKTVTVTTVLN